MIVNPEVVEVCTS